MSDQDTKSATMPGQVRVGKVRYVNGKQVPPSYPGFKPIVVLTKSSAYGALGPYVLKDEHGRIMENLWQGAKVYPEVPVSRQIYSPYQPRVVWDWSAETHVQDGKLTEQFWAWRKALLNAPDPVRYPVGKELRKTCIGVLLDEDEEHENPLEHLLPYIESRKRLYFPLYCRLVKKQPQFKRLQKLLRAGTNLLVIEVDVCYNDLPYYRAIYGVPDDFIDQGTMLVTRANMNIVVNDPKYPAGHGYGLAMALLGVDEEWLTDPAPYLHGGKLTFEPSIEAFSHSSVPNPTMSAAAISPAKASAQPEVRQCFPDASDDCDRCGFAHVTSCPLKPPASYNADADGDEINLHLPRADAQTVVPRKIKPKPPIKRRDAEVEAPRNEEEACFFEFTPASSGRCVAPLALFDVDDDKEWEEAYQTTMDRKYAKGTRNYSKKITGSPVEDGEAPIFLIPRERGGPSYKDVDLEGVETSDVQFCAISKGFGMQDVSSFTLGPIVGHGLCLVNAAYSKAVCVMHLVGGGVVDLSRKDFWRPGTPKRKIQLLTRAADETLLRGLEIASEDTMLVDKEECKIEEWLRDNEAEWLPEWEKWSRSVALCSSGDFHWTDKSPTVAYRHCGTYLGFVDWKKQCYIIPSLVLMDNCSTYDFLRELHEKGIPLGLVHPKAITGHTEMPISRGYLRALFDSETEMCCQPMVVAAKLLGVKPYA